MASGGEMQRAETYWRNQADGPPPGAYQAHSAVQYRPPLEGWQRGRVYRGAAQGLPLEGRSPGYNGAPSGAGEGDSGERQLQQGEFPAQGCREG